MNNPDKRGPIIGDLIILGLVAESMLLMVVTVLALKEWLR